jgi:3-deoxy-7-phosphoheptulonate synthase / chorismate mutase
MTVESLRAEITALDLQILEAVNARIETVEKLRHYKAQHGLPFVDPDREQALLQELKAANRGPLSESGVEELVTFMLALVKREVTNE